MITLLCVICTAIVTAVLPVLVRLAARQFPAFKPLRANPLWVYFAALLMVVSVFLPDIHISNQTQTFQQHFVGGGMYTACLFIYAKYLFGWRLPWYSEAVLLFAWVSTLGVAVELFEFLTMQIGIVHLANADTDWDLLANTLGAFTLFIITKATVKHAG